MRNFIFLITCVLLMIAGCTKKSAPTIAKEPVTVAKEKAAIVKDTVVTVTIEDLKAGAALYAHNCTRCHGATGVEGKAPNLTQIDDSIGEMIGTITYGQGHMPPFARKLSEKEIASVANFVALLKK